MNEERKMEGGKKFLWQGVIRHYREYLPIKKDECIVTLLEGNTPLIPSRRLAAEIGKGTEIYFKFEGLNPTGSFKDRGMTMAICKAMEEGAKAVICASTGNTSASAPRPMRPGPGMKCLRADPGGQDRVGQTLPGHDARRGQWSSWTAILTRRWSIVRELGEKYHSRRS